MAPSTASTVRNQAEDMITWEWAALNLNTLNYPHKMLGFIDHSYFKQNTKIWIYSEIVQLAYTTGI